MLIPFGRRHESLIEILPVFLGGSGVDFRTFSGS